MTDESQRGSAGGAGRRLLALFIPLMALGLLAKSVQGVQGANAIDFYHFWGVQAARDIDASLAGNPYTEPQLTASILNRHSDGLGDEVLMQVNRNRRVIDPTGTPLFYACFAPLPLDFKTSFVLFRWLQFLALVGGLVLVARASGVSWLGGLALAGYGGLTLGPFTTDLKVGNVNSIQLLILVGLGWLGSRSARDRDSVFGPLLLGACVLATLFKPNILPATGMVALSRLATTGMRRFAFETGLAAVVGVLAILGSCWWFDDFGVWGDWYTFLHGNDSTKLIDYPTAKGNVAPPTMFAEWTGIGATFATLGIFGALAASALGAVMKGAVSAGRSPLVHARERFADPWLALAVGVTVALAVPPLFWYHYFVWALVAPLWIVLAHGRSLLTTSLGTAALTILWGPPLYLLIWLGIPEWNFRVQSLAWIPIWVALLVLIARPGRTTEVSA